MTTKQLGSILNRFFNKKKKQSKKLSIRQLSATLKASPSMLSLVLNGKRLPSVFLLNKLCSELDIDQETADSMRLFLLKKKSFMDKKDIAFIRSNTETEQGIDQELTNDPWVLASRDQFNIALSSWHYFAILQTTLLKQYDGSADFISNFLGLNRDLVVQMCAEMEEVHLLSKDPKTGYLRKVSSQMEYQSKSKERLRQHHISNMEKAIHTLKNKNTNYNCENRLITSTSFSCSTEKITLIKQEISRFIKKIANTDESEGHDEVCQFSIQFFPLSNK
ncbi:TIGR02147 family protein [bacterium]|nr:TIGR02147 family protein [bacterium]